MLFEGSIFGGGWYERRCVAVVAYTERMGFLKSNVCEDEAPITDEVDKDKQVAPYQLF